MAYWFYQRGNEWEISYRLYGKYVLKDSKHNKKSTLLCSSLSGKQKHFSVIKILSLYENKQ